MFSPVLTMEKIDSNSKTFEVHHPYLQLFFRRVDVLIYGVKKKILKKFSPLITPTIHEQGTMD
ncbi:MAG: hypothetical protein CMO59_08585 [Verrucomicrobiales bacterium]|nr:hypothetical protein [Verrucomicrobiales bacterium]|tara:strand:+ start:210 stop:398 length:189 start_codon:yes stop_codon:yes gene_type:complete